MYSIVHEAEYLLDQQWLTALFTLHTLQAVLLDKNPSAKKMTCSRTGRLLCMKPQSGVPSVICESHRMNGGSPIIRRPTISIVSCCLSVKKRTRRRHGEQKRELQPKREARQLRDSTNCTYGRDFFVGLICCSFFRPARRLRLADALHLPGPNHMRMSWPPLRSSVPSPVMRLDEVFNNPTGSANVAVRDENLYSTASRSVMSDVSPQGRAGSNAGPNCFCRICEWEAR